MRPAFRWVARDSVGAEGFTGKELESSLLKAALARTPTLATLLRKCRHYQLFN